MIAGSKVVMIFANTCDSRMSYTNLDPKSIEEKRQSKGHKIKRSMSQHVFEYVPNSKIVYNSQYLCECEYINA